MLIGVFKQDRPATTWWRRIFQVVVLMTSLLIALSVHSATRISAKEASFPTVQPLDQSHSQAAESDYIMLRSEPSYARWGRLAVKQTQSRYGTGITDYLYEGHFPVSGSRSEERFKLLLQPKPGAPAAVLVVITVEEGRLLRVEWRETRP